MSISWTADELDQNRRMNKARSGRIVPKGLRGAKCADCSARRSPLALYRADTGRRACRPCLTIPADDTYAAAVARVSAPAPIKTRKARKAAPVAPPEPVQDAPDALTLCNACEINAADPASPAGYCIDCERDAREQTEPATDVQDAPDEPAPVSIAPAPVLAVLAPDGRPTCERCGQVFRKRGTGAEWHRVNRPDCVGTAARPSIAS